MIRILDPVGNLNLDFKGALNQGNSGLAPYISLDGATNYGVHPGDDFNGTNGFTVGGWFQPGSSGPSYIISKWATANDAWLLFYNANIPTFYVGSPVPTPYSVVGATCVIGQWVFIACRYTPSAEIAIWVNSSKAVNVTSIPASLLVPTNLPLYVGVASDLTDYYTGRISMLFYCNSILSDLYINTLYGLGRTVYNV